MKKKMIPALAAALAVIVSGSLAAGPQLVFAAEKDSQVSSEGKEKEESGEYEGDWYADWDDYDDWYEDEAYYGDWYEDGAYYDDWYEDGDYYGDWYEDGDYYGDWYEYGDDYDDWYGDLGICEDCFGYAEEERFEDGEADRKESLTEEELQTLSEIEAEIDAVWSEIADLYAESGEWTEEEEEKLAACEEQLDQLYEKAGILYDKIEAYQYQKLVDDGVITTEEKDTLLAAYDRIEELEKQIEEEEEGISEIENKIFENEQKAYLCS